MIVKCCVCQKIKTNKGWKRGSAPIQSVSHSYCPVCDVRARIGFKRERKAAMAMK